MHTLQLQFYGVLKQLAGKSRDELQFDDGETVAVVMQRIGAQFPAIAGVLTTVATVRGDEIIDDATTLHHGDTLGLLPPVSGGSVTQDAADNQRYLTAEPLSLDALLSETDDERAGALAIFAGTVRNMNDGLPVTGMTYEAHPALAVRVLQDLEREAREKFGVLHCRAQHRIGALALGETSVLIVVRSAHRAPAFDALRYVIEELKQRLPVWKQEHYVSADSRYLDGAPLKPDPKS